jgi:hypothetical protein
MNANRRRVIIYGDTLILEGLRANLENHPDFEILVVDPASDSPLEALQFMCPAVVFFDQGDNRQDFLFSLLRQPDLLLIGIDPHTRQALVWTGRRSAAVAAADLIRIFQLTEA